MHYTLENTPLAVQCRSQFTVRRADYSISLPHNNDDDGGVLHVTWKPVGTDYDEFVELKFEVTSALGSFVLVLFVILRFKMEKLPTFTLGSVLTFFLSFFFNVESLTVELGQSKRLSGRSCYSGINA